MLLLVPGATLWGSEVRIHTYPRPPPNPRPNTMSQTGKVAWTEPQMYMVEGGGGRVVMLPALGPERI